MVQHYARLDATFAALCDATRRHVLERLGRADASISDLAGAFGMTLTGMKKRVQVLGDAGLVSTEKVGRRPDGRAAKLTGGVPEWPFAPPDWPAGTGTSLYTIQVYIVFTLAVPLDAR